MPPQAKRTTVQTAKDLASVDALAQPQAKSNTALVVAGVAIAVVAAMTLLASLGQKAYKDDRVDLNSQR